MSLDILTLYFVATLVAAMLGALLLVFWRREKIAALGWWGGAYLLGGAVIGLWTLGGAYLHYPGSVATICLGFIACGMVWNAARVFHGRRVAWFGIGIGALLWAGADHLLAPHSSFRIILGIVIVATYAALTASELAQERRRALQSRWPAMIVPSLQGVVMMMPILWGDFMRGDETAVHSGWVALFAIEIVLGAVGTVFIIFMLVSERAVRAHKAAAAIDPLTGLFNRRGFSELASRMIEREARAGRLVTALIFDIDYFKSVNDRFGHPAGDEILALFGKVLSQTLRATDLVGRIGGEEFAAALPCAVDEAAIAAERVRAAFAKAGVEIDGTPLETTVSIGVAGGPPGLDLTTMLAAADTALYRAKRGGRNRVEIATEAPLSLEEQRLAAAVQPQKARPTVVHHLEKSASSLASAGANNPPFTGPCEYGSMATLDQHRSATASLEAMASAARSGFACMFATSAEYESALIDQRRAEGRYNSSARLPTGLFILCSLGIAAIVLIAS